MAARILIIDGEASLREALIETFKKAGFAVADAPDYQQALAKVVTFKPGAIIMDTALADRDGFEACSELHNHFDIPVILLGQDSDDCVWERVMEAGADHYEVKPCKYLALVARVKAILRRYRKDGKSTGGKSGAGRD